MRWPVPWLLLVLVLALLVPAALPAAADDEGDGSGDQRGGGGDDDRDDGNERDDEDADRDNGDDEDRRRAKDDKDKGDQGRNGDGRGKDGKGDGKGKDRDRGERDADDRRRGGKFHGNGDRDDAPAPAADVVEDPRSDAAPVPGLRVDQDYAMAPGVLTYTFTVRHDGHDAAPDARLRGDLPDVGAWVVTDPRCTVDAGAVSCALGDLAPHSVERIQATAVLTGRIPAFTNVVQVYTPAPPSSP